MKAQKRKKGGPRLFKSCRATDEEEEQQVLKRHYAVFSILLLLTPFCIQIFSSSCSQTPSVSVLPLVRDTKFHIHTKTSPVIIFMVYFNINILDMKREDKIF
jgi:hypothetical protein